jgi:pantothenate kinase
MYKLQTHRHLNKAPDLTDVARIAVPLYIATRVLKVSEQNLPTRALNAHARTFK